MGLHDYGDVHTYRHRRAIRDFEYQRRGGHADRATGWNGQVKAGPASVAGSFASGGRRAALLAIRDRELGPAGRCTLALIMWPDESPAFFVSGMRGRKVLGGLLRWKLSRRASSLIQ